MAATETTNAEYRKCVAITATAMVAATTNASRRLCRVTERISKRLIVEYVMA